MSPLRRFLLKSSSSVLHRSKRLKSHTFTTRKVGPQRLNLARSEASVLSRRSFSAPSRESAEGRLAQTLYRGLLRWCDESGNDVPLASFVPPVHLSPPSIDESGLKNLASTAVESKTRSAETDSPSKLIFNMLPDNSIVEPHQLTVPIRNVSDVRGLLRALFRLNSDAVNDAAAAKKRTSLAFDALKSLNQLTGALQQLQKQREDHLDRTGVAFSVGEVVQHKHDRWRGVVIDWRRTRRKEKDSSNIDSPTSLTQKDYTDMLSSVEDETSEDVEYSLILDIGDAHLLGGRRKVNDQSGVPVASETDLERVSEASLCRVRSNWIPRHFERFDTIRNRFVPNDGKNYAYPSDNSAIPGEAPNVRLDEAAVDITEVGEQVIDGVQHVASRLERCILETTGLHNAGLDLLTAYQERLSSLSRGDVTSNRDLLSPSTPSLEATAILHLRKLLNISLEIFENEWHRRLSKEHKASLQFSLGDIVKHKKYGFRGVVVAWDPKPTVDVSRWDGLAEIENPMELPFYHVIPDQNDCIRIFGGERPFRYVCQSNLDKCSQSNALIEVDLDPEWHLSPSRDRYMAPDDVKFKYAEDLGDEGVTSRCIIAIKDELSRLQVALRDSLPKPASVEEKLSMKNLFALLCISDNMDDAVVVEETIKEIWKAHADPVMRWRLDDGVADLLHGKKEKALSIFSQLVQDDPGYAEAWNKKSTCHFMLGDMDLSLEAAERTLELEPNHFQALNGLGLVQYENKRYKLSAEAFRRSMALDPWSPASSRLSLCLDVLNTVGVEDEGATEGSAPYET